jgi:hypothetical protein
MRKPLTFFFLSISLLAILASRSDADVIKLKSGQTHKGAITAEEEDRVQLKLEGSGVRIWFQRDQIASLEKDGKSEKKTENAAAKEEEENVEGLSEDMIRARELLKKLREQPAQNTTKKTSASNEPVPIETTTEPVTSTASTDEVVALIETLRNGKFYDRLSACKKLGNLGAKESVKDLIHFLDDENVKIREECNDSLVKITGQDFGFKATAPRNVRLWAIDKWKDWYEEEQKKGSSFSLKWLW